MDFRVPLNSPFLMYFPCTLRLLATVLLASPGPCDIFRTASYPLALMAGILAGSHRSCVIKVNLSLSRPVRIARRD